MFSKKVVIHLDKKDDIFHLEPLSDVHVGHAGFDTKLYKSRVNAISRNDDRYTIFLGDQFDAITTYDKRFNPDLSLIHDVDNQRKMFQSLTQNLFDTHKSRMISYQGTETVWNETTKSTEEIPKQMWRVKKTENEKIWGLLHGNHEYNIREATRSYLENNVCDPNGLTFLGSRALIGLEVYYNKKILAQWIISAIHGSGGGKPETLMERQMKHHYCDVFISGHLHQKRYTPTGALSFDFDTGEAVKMEIHSINAGTFCDSFVEGADGYMDRKAEFQPTNLGTTTLSFNAEQQKIVGHI